MKQIREPIEHHETEYRLFFQSRRTPGWGFSFECDAHGNVDLTDLRARPYALVNYCRALDADEFGEGVIETHQLNWRESALWRCDCGQEMECDGFTNTCEGCGRDYNWAGQQLAPRSQWGEETGEYLADIERIH